MKFTKTFKIYKTHDFTEGEHMKKIISFILALLVFSSNIFFIASCNSKTMPLPPTEECTLHADTDFNGECDSCHGKMPEKAPPEEPKSEIKVPEYKDYLRGTENFDELIYSRPDISAALVLFDSVCTTISENSVTYPEQKKKLSEVKAVYDNVRSMNAIVTIYNYKDVTNEFWKAEYLYLTTNYPLFTQGIEKIFVSAANSPYKTSFEKDFFGNLDAYVNGGIYTDEAVALMKAEAELEAEYSSISTANVVISYADTTDTYDAILESYKNKFGENSPEYIKVKTLCDELFKEAVAKIEAELLVELIKTRKQISNALGYESYDKFAYETLYHDYSPEEAEEFISSVTETVIPVYLNLSRELFSPYIYEYEKKVPSSKVCRSDVLNTLYDVYTEFDPKLAEIYSYMLQHKLYDVENGSSHRFNASFTTYIETNSSPFLFVTLDGSILDYSSMAHEFGHFADGYINNDSDSSLDLLEVSSQAMELLTLTKFKNKLDEDTYNYFVYLKLDEILSTIIFQSFYASFEIEAYKLDYEDITIENLNAIVSSVAKEFGFSSLCNSVEYVAIPHIFLYPFYVQSYATSAAAALEIYTLEIKNEGDGFDAYMSLLARDEESILSFEEALLASKLSSPFENNALKKIINDLHYATLGAYFFKTQNGNAA